MEKITIAWAGFCEDKLDYGWDEDKSFQDGHYGIFKTKKEAKEHYEEVRKIIIKAL